MTIADVAQREQALDPTRSFIVQAPAGSGKTELLIQRYLKLLSNVKAPEEIIAITFTRKASAEMKNRVLKALDQGKNDSPPKEPHALKTWELARKALIRNEKHSWHIFENPSQMKIQTIDSLCAGLTRQMPFLSQFGAQPGITDRPESLYQEAARRTVADLESDITRTPSIEALFRHLDNHLAKIENLIAGMLAKRDQWLRHVVDASSGNDQRRSLEKALSNLVEDALASLRKQFSRPGLDQLIDFAKFAAKNLKKDGSESLICFCDDLSELPGTGPADANKWTGLAELLLTQNGQWRKTVSKNTGFPAPSSEEDKTLKLIYQEKKNSYKDYISSLSEDDELASALHNVRILPAREYTEDQWQIMKALFDALMVAVVNLEAVFKGAGEVDFAEIGLRTKKALGDPDNPTDLTLTLDYRISHILMDEFQDTSFTQNALIESLTAGWTPGDGRTFFAVGDPMQSIYAFREAEVGLFLNARENGISQLQLESLTLSVNFRSQKGIIDWVNDSFSEIMPEAVDVTTGAVSYSPSVAVHPLLYGPAVEVHPFVPTDGRAEASEVVKCILKARKSDPKGSIAVLVRGRAHLESIIPALKEAHLSFFAVEIDSLKSRPVITDLMSLARALSHPADRIAWLALVRAPWCGLTLKDLHILVDNAPDKTIIELLTNKERISNLSQDGQKRLSYIVDILITVLANRNRKSLRRLVEGVWVSLGGPACVFDASEIRDVEVFLDLLEQQAGNGVLTDFKAVEDSAAALFARPVADADETLQIMTIHKAKGLEFDTVILPALEKSPPPAESQLLLWLERSKGRSKNLLLAPITETGAQKDKIYNYIHKIYEKKRSLEDARLLYVAATRAKKKLHIMGGVGITQKSGEIRQPFAKSLLCTLWPAVSERFYQLHRGKGKTIESDNEPEGKEQISVPYLRRFADAWQGPETPPEITWSSDSVPKPEVTGMDKKPEFDWAGETARHVGIVVHAWLRVICEDGLDHWDENRIESMTLLLKTDLARSGVGSDSIELALKQVKDALINALSDDRGRWILSGHTLSQCEYALTGNIDDRILNAVIDRTFIDDKGVRWIIDYKTGAHKGGSVEDFLDREQLRYKDQLEVYRKLMEAKEGGEVRLGLYFPQLKGWREI